MDKDKLILFVRKSTKYYGENDSPSEIYDEFIKNSIFKPLFNNRMTAKDGIIYCFLMARRNEDLSSIYDEINENLASFNLLMITSTPPKQFCEYCEEGSNTCDNCDGEGVIDDDDCASCDGNGRIPCGFCDGDEHDESYGKVELEMEDSVLLEGNKSLTYNKQFVDELIELGNGVGLDYERVQSLIDSNYLIYLEHYDDIMDKDLFEEPEEETYVSMDLKISPNLVWRNDQIKIQK